jgi:hypothetical protein
MCWAGLSHDKGTGSACPVVQCFAPSDDVQFPAALSHSAPLGAATFYSLSMSLSVSAPDLAPCQTRRASISLHILDARLSRLLRVLCAHGKRNLEPGSWFIMEEKLRAQLRPLLNRLPSLVETCF